MPGGGKSKKSKNKCTLDHGVLGSAPSMAWSIWPLFSLPAHKRLHKLVQLYHHHFTVVFHHPRGCKSHLYPATLKGIHHPQKGVQASTLNLHHSDSSDHFSPPTGVQVSTVNLHPSQHNPMPGTVTSTTNCYVPTTQQPPKCQNLTFSVIFQ